MRLAKGWISVGIRAIGTLAASFRPRDESVLSTQRKESGERARSARLVFSSKREGGFRLRIFCSS